jgi:hypothetical protein
MSHYGSARNGFGGNGFFSIIFPNLYRGNGSINKRLRGPDQPYVGRDVTTELITYGESAGEYLDDIYRKSENPNEVYECMRRIVPDFSDSIISTRDFSGDPFVEMMDELFS